MAGAGRVPEQVPVHLLDAPERPTPFCLGGSAEAEVRRHDRRQVVTPMMALLS